MAQPILCDYHGLTHLADLMVTTLDGGNVVSYCHEGFAEVMYQTVERMVDAENARTAAEAEAKLAEAAPAAPDPGTAHVVRRGTSKSRREHEDRKAARLTAQADQTEAPELDAELAASLDEDAAYRAAEALDDPPADPI